MELPRQFLVRESSHRIPDPFTPEKLAVLLGWGVFTLMRR